MNRAALQAQRETITMTTLRVKTREVVERAFFGQVLFVVRVYGRPMAVIMGIDQFERLASSAPNEIYKEITGAGHGATAFQQDQTAKSERA